jgi:hypothetical protein
MGCTEFAQPIHHVAEEFVVPALVGTHRDTVGIFLDRRADDVINAAVVSVTAPCRLFVGSAADRWRLCSQEILINQWFLQLQKF